ncbi:spore germination protein, partial [Paenibacillus macerans]
KKRGIEQPQTEQVIRGAREGFIEALETNLSLIRYRLQSPSLKIETGDIGARTKSKVAVCYMDGIANPELIGEVMRR